MIVRDESLHILQHALGLDDYGRSKHDGRREHQARTPARTEDCYRNRFVLSEGGKDWTLCVEHVEAGRMTKHGPSPMFGGERGYCFCVTEAGLSYVRERSPKPPKESRGKRRWAAFTSARDAYPDLTFPQFLKMQKELGHG